MIHTWYALFLISGDPVSGVTQARAIHTDRLRNKSTTGTIPSTLIV